MDALHAMAANGARDGTAMVADVLTKGRGARRRTWHAPRGGLWLSVLRRPHGAPTAGVLSLRVGLALAVGLERLIGVRVELKWPNDLMLADRKVGGILCELRWQGSDLAWAVIGLGVNVENPLPDAVRAHATALVEHAPAASLDEVRAMALAVVRELDVDRATLDPEELAAFAARDWLAARAIVAPARGICRGITQEGALHIAGEDGKTRLLRSSEGLMVEATAGVTSRPSRA